MRVEKRRRVERGEITSDEKERNVEEMKTERGTEQERRMREKTGEGKEEMEMEGSLLNGLSFSPLGNTNCIRGENQKHLKVFHNLGQLNFLIQDVFKKKTNYTSK